MLEQEWTNFTFCGEKEDQCYVVLTNTITGTVNRIEVPQAYYVGSLRSIAVADLSLEDEEYYFEINGQKVMDPCAHAIMGSLRVHFSTSDSLQNLALKWRYNRG